MKTRVLIPLCSLIASLPLVAGDSISLNFGSDDPDTATSEIVDAGKVSGAIPIAGDLWNNLTGPNGTDVAVTADAGAGGTVTWTSANTWRSDSTGSTPTSENGALTKGYLDDGGGGNTITVNSPYLLNDIYIITGTDNPGTSSPFSVNGTFYKGDGAGGTVMASGAGDSYSAAAWSDADTLTESDNYIKVADQASVAIAGLNSSPGRASIAGVQVEDAYTGTLSYWDSNGLAAGSGDAGGTWGSDPFWSTSADGDVATAAWTPGDAAVFSAGTDGVSANIVTVTGTQSADAIWVQEGDITFTGGTLDLSSGLGLLRVDGSGLIVNSQVTAADLTTSGSVELNSAGNSVTGLATIGGNTTLGANHTFPRIGGAGTLDIVGNALTVGDASDSNFGGSFGGSGGSVDKVGTGTVILGSPTNFIAGSATVSAGTLGFTNGSFNMTSFSGVGNFAKAGGGQLNVLSDITTTGSVTLDGGTLQIGNVNDLGSIPAGASMVLNSGLLRYRHDTLADTIAGPVSIGAAEIRQHAGSTSTLTVTGNVTSQTTDANGNAVNGTIGSSGGEIIFGSGTTSAVGMLQLGNGTASVEAGADLSFRYLNIGSGGGASGIINQTGGKVTMEAGSHGVRIGHWSGAGRQLNITGGTFDSTALAGNGDASKRFNAGWDGEGDVSVGGGVGAATLKVYQMWFDRNRAGAGSSASTATVLPNGLLEVGAGGFVGQGDNDGTVMSGGIIRGTASSNWNTAMDSTVATSSSIDVNNGVTVSQNYPINGSGALDKTGLGTLVLRGAAGTYNGAASVSGGILRISGNPLPTAASVTAASGGTIGAGDAGTVGTGTLTTLNLEAGSASVFRVGASSDQLVVSGLDGLTTAATHAISVQPGAAVTVSDVFPVIDYNGSIQGAGFGGLSLAASSNPHYTLSLSNNLANTTIDVTVDAVTPITWTGPGTAWNLASSNWDAGDGSGTSLFYDADIAIFGDLDPTESVVVDDNGGADPISPASMTFNNTTATSYTVSGDPISGIGGLTKTGDGTVILTNDNTFTGAIDIQDGTLQIGDGGTTGSLAAGDTINVGLPAEIVFDRTDASTLSRPTIGDGELVLNDGALTVSAANNGIDMVINGGTLLARSGSWGTSFNGGKTITVNTGGTLDTTTHALGGLGGATLPSLIDLNGGTWLFNNEHYANNLTMTGGMTTGTGEIRTTGGGIFTINASAGGSTMANRVNMVGGKTFQVADGAAATDLLISAPITGGGALTKTGTGTLVTSGANTGAGNINVDEGEVVFTGDNSARTGGTALNGTMLNTASVSNAAIGSGFLALNGGTLNYSGAGAEVTTRLLWIDQGSGTFNISNATGVLTMNPSGGAVNFPVTKDGPGHLIMQGAITGPASVTANGGRLDLDGANTYTGDTTINTGALVQMASATLDDDSTLLINASGVLNLAHGANDVIGALELGGVPQTAPGTYGAAGSGADFESTFFAGTGTVEIVNPDDYETWAIDNGYWTPGAPNTLPGDDFDRDNRTNEYEYAFGLDPTDASSFDPYSAPFDPATGMFSYTRRDPALTGWTYVIETSTTLVTYVVDATATQTPGATDSEGNQTVVVTLTGGAPADPDLFVRVVGTAPAP